MIEFEWYRWRNWVPAPRYVNESQARAVWAGLTGLWCLGGLLAWLGAVGTSASWTGSSSLFALLAAATGGISLALRLPILTATVSASSPAPSASNYPSLIQHLVWLLGTFASLNWLGFLILQAPHWSETLPAVLLVLVSEIWLHVAIWRQSALPWLQQGLGQPLGRLASLGIDPLSRPVENVPRAANTITPQSQGIIGDSGSSGGPDDQLDESVGWPGVDVDLLAEGVDRRQVHGMDENGQRYWSGEIRVDFASQQQIQQVTVAFAPPFSVTPQVDWEIDGDEAQIKLVNCTPTGMRLEIRRISDQEPLIFPLQWYAAELELGNMAAAANAKRVLP